MSRFCIHCQRPLSRCLCSLTHAVENRTHVIILQHAKERIHPKGTAKLAQLCLNHSELITGKDFSEELDRINRVYAPILLWPDQATETASRQAQAQAQAQAQISTDTEKTLEKAAALIVIDGTWKKAAKIYHTHSALRQMPKLNLQGYVNQYHHRKSPSAEHLSTLEAIYYGLKALTQGEDVYHQELDNLLTAQRRMIDRWQQMLPASVKID